MSPVNAQAGKVNSSFEIFWNHVLNPNVLDIELAAEFIVK